MRVHLRFLAALAGCALWLVMAGGCGYQLQGLVVPGQVPSVVVVEQDDPRLKQPGLEGALVMATIDPNRLTSKSLAPRTTDSAGQFAIGVDEPGAGLLEYQVRVVAQAPGYQSGWQTLPLPAANKRFLITLVPGRDSTPPPTDLIEETLRQGGHPLGQ